MPTIPKRFVSDSIGMKIVDCFVFYDEIDLLHYRLKLLEHIVDKFVIVESYWDREGNAKKLYSQELEDLFETFRDKIVHIVVDSFPYTKGERWKIEKYQINRLYDGINSLRLQDTDVLLLTYLNETPSPHLLQTIKRRKQPIQIHCLEMDIFHSNVKLSTKWILGKILSYKMFKKLSLSCSDLRNYKCPTMPNGGSHLTFPTSTANIVSFLDTSEPDYL